MIETAQQRGQDIGFELHTRLFGTALPPWALDGGPKAIASRLIVILLELN